MQIIPFDKREGFIWFDGQLVNWQDATIHVLNHGLHYASTVFEGERAYNGKIFASHEHAERFIKSAQILGMTIPYNVKQLVQAKIQVLESQNLTEAYIRPVAWKGSEKMTIEAPNNTVHVAIAAWAWPNFYKDKSVGISLTLSPWIRPHPKSAPTDSKAAGLYMISSLSKEYATEKGFDDALMLDYRGYVAEASAANFFIVKDNVIHTPIADCFLNGITRQTVIAIAKARNIKVIERYIELAELSEADEMFITGTAAEITPVIKLDEHKFLIGEITKLMMDDYHQLTHG